MQESKSPPPITTKKNIFSQFVYQTNNKLRRGFKSGSFVESPKEEPGTDDDGPKKDMSIQTNFKSETHISRHSKVEIFKESYTQTSKTILALVQEMETARLSPDSLSPKKETNEEDFPYSDVGSSIETVLIEPSSSLSFNRRGDVAQYLDSNDEQKKLNLLSGSSLTKTFLEQKRNKTKSFSPPNIQRLFEQQKQIQQVENLKSQSYVDQPHIDRCQSYADPPPSQINSPNTLTNKVEKTQGLARFRVKSVSEKIPEDKTKPVRYFCQSSIQPKVSNIVNESDTSPTKPRRSMSFMSPTISSDNKDQRKEIKSLEKLISPTRRGRSASPKKHHIEETREIQKVPYTGKRDHSGEPSREKAKIPYIDKSEVSIQPSPFGDAKADTTRVDSQRCDDSGGSQPNLDLRLSCEDLTNSTVVGSVTSVTSTESILFQALGKLRDKDWSLALRGLAEVVEICRALDTDLAYPHMTIINQRLIELMKSPRSHVCRTACQAMGHLFEYVKDTRRPEFDEIVDTLLCKTADANKFIRHDANLALDCMVTHIPTFHAIRALTTKGPDHKNALVRIAAARLIVCAVVLAGPQNILNPNSNEYTRKRIILNMVKFLDDKDMGARKFGERLYKLFYKDRIFDIYLKRYLEREVILKIKKCLRSFNGEKL